MGHRTGWLTLCAGIAGGADVILIPEIPYDLKVIADYLLERRRRGSRFSIIAVAEGAISVEDVKAQADHSAKGRLTAEQVSKSSKKKKKAKSPGDLGTVPDDIDDYHLVREPISSRIARRLQEMTRIEARVISLGHVQ
jgi:6-phosphofructokinase 1